MAEEPVSTAQKPPGKPGWSLGLGIFGLVAWLIPILGLPVSIVGLVFGVKALKRAKIGLAVAGIVLCSLGIGLSAFNAGLGVYLNATGQGSATSQATGK